MAFQIVSGILGANVAPAGTFTATLPTNIDTGRVAGAVGHMLEMNQASLAWPNQFSTSLGGSNGVVTITNKTASTWLAGQSFILQMNQLGDAGGLAPARGVQGPVFSKYSGMLCYANAIIVNLGSPATKSTTAILATSAAFETAITNPLTSVITVPGGSNGRALQVTSSSASDTTQTILVAGTDFLGVAMDQLFTLNGTAVISGTKAFSTVTSITASATTVGTISVGTLDVFGLPSPLEMSGLIFQDLTDGAKSGTQGTYVTADVTAGGATNITGDVRGTFAPNTASNGTHYYHIIMFAPDAFYPGTVQDFVS